MIDLTGIDDSDVEINTALHSPALNLNRDTSIPKASPDTDDQPTQQPNDFVEANISSYRTIYSQPPQQRPELHIKTYSEVANLPSIFSSTSPKNIPGPSPLISRDQIEHIRPIDSTSTVSPEALANIAPILKQNYNLEASSNEPQSNVTDPTPCSLLSGANDGRAETSRLEPDLEQPSSQRRDRPLVPLVKIVEDRRKIGCSKPTDPEAQRDQAMPVSRPTLSTETFTQHSSTYAHNSHRSCVGLSTPNIAEENTPTQESHPQNQQSRSIVEDNKWHSPPVSINQNALHKDNVSQVSQLPSPISPELPPPAWATSSNSIHTQLHPSPISPSAPPNISCSETLSHSTQTFFRHPPVVFTDNDDVNCDLTPTQLKALTTPFDRIARICIKTPKSQDTLDAPKYFPIGAIMWCELKTFYKWYSKTSSNYNNRLLRFELINVTCQSARSFIISEDECESFRLLKQYIWDMFWMESKARGPLKLFTVTIVPYLPVLNQTSHHEDRNLATSVSPSIANEIQHVGPAIAAEPPSELPDLNSPDSSAQISPIPRRTSAKKLALRLVSISALYQSLVY